MTTIRETMATRIRRARKLKGWSQAELAAHTQFHPDTIARYETGDAFISDDALCRISDAFNLHPAYFFKEENLSFGKICFQRNGKLTQKEKDQIIEIIKEKAERLINAIEVFDSPPVPKFEETKNNVLSEEDSLNLACKISNEWGITSESNLIRIIESKGILFFEVPGVTAKFNGLTTTVDGFPVIAVNSRNPQQQRLAIAHELAHLLGIESEDLCDSFANRIPPKSDETEKIEKSSLLEDLVWRAWNDEIIYHNTAARLLGISQSDFQDMVEKNLEKR